MRACKACGRDVHDPEEHELVKVPNLQAERPGDPKFRRFHVCKNLVLIAENSARDLVTGERRVIKRYVPEKTVEIDGEPTQVLDPQRTAMNHTRWVHSDTLAAQARNNA